MQRISQADLNEELLKQWAIQARRSPPPVIVALMLIAYMASQYVAVWYWGAWLLLAVAMQWVRWQVFRKLPDLHHVPVDRRIKVVIAINLAGTLVNSASLLWFPLFTPYQCAVLSMIYIGLGVGSVMMSAGFTPIARHHVFFGLLPLYVLWLWSGLFGPGGSTALVLGVIGFGYSALIYRVAGNVFQLYQESFETRKQLEVALERAESAGRAKTRFLASASHDLRQPMHALSLFSAALATRKLEDNTREIVDNINASVEALAYELDGLLDISKLDAGIVAVNRGKFSLYAVLRRLLEEFSPLAEKRGISMRLTCPEPAMAHTDGTLLERIIRNLVTNAINHNTQCELTLQVVPVGNRWRLTVKDTGRGIDPAQHESIFEEFFQLENPERDRSKGLGLGLSIVRRLSNLLAIDMQLQSAPGAGTEFSFTIDAIEQEPVAVLAEDPAPRSAELLHSLVVLIVDDEKLVREGMSALLKNLGCRVVTADSTESALAAAATEEPDIALVDARLRGDDSGLAAIEQLRAFHPGLPAVIVSGDTAPDRLLAFDRASIPVLVKPVLVGPLKEALIRCCFPAMHTAGRGAQDGGSRFREGLGD